MHSRSRGPTVGFVSAGKPTASPRERGLDAHLSRRRAAQQGSAAPKQPSTITVHDDPFYRSLMGRNHFAGGSPVTTAPAQGSDRSSTAPPPMPESATATASHNLLLVGGKSRETVQNVPVTSHRLVELTAALELQRAIAKRAADETNDPTALRVTAEQAMEAMRQSGSVRKAAQTFFRMDGDRDGALEAQELQRALAAQRLLLSDAELARLMALVDDDRSGTVDVSEFLRHCHSYSGDPYARHAALLADPPPGQLPADPAARRRHWAGPAAAAAVRRAVGAFPALLQALPAGKLGAGAAFRALDADQCGAVRVPALARFLHAELARHTAPAALSVAPAALAAGAAGVGGDDRWGGGGRGGGTNAPAAAAGSSSGDALDALAAAADADGDGFVSAADLRALVDAVQGSAYDGPAFAAYGAAYAASTSAASGGDRPADSRQQRLLLPAMSPLRATTPVAAAGGGTSWVVLEGLPAAAPCGGATVVTLASARVAPGALAAALRDAVEGPRGPGGTGSSGGKEPLPAPSPRHHRPHELLLLPPLGARGSSSGGGGAAAPSTVLPTPPPPHVAATGYGGFDPASSSAWGAAALSRASSGAAAAATTSDVGGGIAAVGPIASTAGTIARDYMILSLPLRPEQLSAATAARSASGHVEAGGVSWLDGHRRIPPTDASFRGEFGNGKRANTTLLPYWKQQTLDTVEPPDCAPAFAGPHARFLTTTDCTADAARASTAGGGVAHPRCDPDTAAAAQRIEAIRRRRSAAETQRASAILFAEDRAAASRDASLAARSAALAVNQKDSVREYFAGRLAMVERPLRKATPAHMRPGFSPVPFRLSYELATS